MHASKLLPYNSIVRRRTLPSFTEMIGQGYVATTPGGRGWLDLLQDNNNIVLEVQQPVE